ncbi:hypothetical protein H257_04383 [Aphanomyces astaci]|uniref:Uncharacterized protein n=1 Tax=Aphanomyces astaci TaxID=112090 RepID=W4GWN0_APHAT|nr:hypothetical protein H257_04383 [Aphanomyces astaci]ETV83736.1 hypothetical protein H257_04383 [Aphanomyces astaci]|eukprot:XP_009827166.1 hypothetical protein H257_04383 [Aphanomyces astaci]
MNVHACLDILNARAGSKHTHEGEDGHHHHHAACVEENASRCLDLKVDATSENSTMEPELEAMSEYELVKTFHACQEKRVLVYQQFEKGFLELMFTDALPLFCTFGRRDEVLITFLALVAQDITKQFSSISNQVNAIERALRARPVAPSIPTILRNVQHEEKEKLLLTSALLLENMRLKRQVTADPDDSSIPIFESSIASMQATHTAIVERINELLTDLRFEMEDIPA